MNVKKGYDKSSSGYLLWVILVLAFCLRLPGLKESVWLDELGYATSTILRDWVVLLNTVLFDKVAPLYRILMFGWIRILGDSEIAIRIPSLVSGIFSIYLSYKITLRFFGYSPAAVTALLLAVSPVHIWYSHEATPYSFLLAIFLLAVFSFYQLKDRGETKWYASYCIALFAAVFTHYSAVIYLLALSAIAVLNNFKYKKKVILANIFILAFFGAYLALKAGLGTFQTKAFYLRPFNFFELWMLFFNWFSLGNSLWNLNPYSSGPMTLLRNPHLMIAQIFYFSLFIYGLRLAHTKYVKSSTRDVDVLLFALPSAMLVLTYAGFNQAYIERGLIIAMPFFYIFLSIGATGAGRPFARRAITTALIILSIASLLSFLVKNQDEWTVYKPKPDWRSVAGYFKDELKAAGEGLAVYTAVPVSELLYYELPFEDTSHFAAGVFFQPRATLKRPYGRSLNVLGFANYPDTDAVCEGLERGGVNAIYAIENTNWEANFKELITKLMKNPHLRLLEVRSFKSLRVYKFQITPQ